MPSVAQLGESKHKIALSEWRDLRYKRTQRPMRHYTVCVPSCTT